MAVDTTEKRTMCHPLYAQALPARMYPVCRFTVLICRAENASMLLLMGKAARRLKRRV